MRCPRESLRRAWHTLSAPKISWPGGWRARLRALCHPFWETEVCGQCGCRVGARTDSWWSADDDLWNEVVGHPYGVLCPPCFTGKCRALGIFVYWRPMVDSRADAMSEEERNG